MTDAVLFRYRRVNGYLFEALSSSTLYFAEPATLNDPFDCQVDIDKCLASAVADSEGDARDFLQTLQRCPNFPSALQGALSKVGICSFSLDLNNPVMWAHYAHDHRGVCLTYRIPEEFFLDERTRIIGVAPTEYGASPLQDWFRTVAPALGEPGSTKMGVALTKKLFTVKGECWAYEKEIRAIREIPGPLEVPRQYLTQVCFGLRTSDEDIEAVQRNVSHDQITYCRMIHDGTDFGIVPNEI